MDGERGYFDPYQPGHHWLIPQKGWGKNIPAWIKNQPWNIKVMKNSVVHNRVHGLFGEPQYSLPQRFWYGTPGWFKAATGGLLGSGAMEAREALKDDR